MQQFWGHRSRQQQCVRDSEIGRGHDVCPEGRREGRRFPPNAFAPKLLSGGQAAAATPFAGLKQMKCSAPASAQFGGFGAKPVFDGGSGADVTVTLRKGSESEPHGLTFADRDAPLHIMAIVDRSPATKGFGAKPQIGQVLVSL